MSVALNIPLSSPLICNKNTLIETGIKFLNQKQQELQIYVDLFNSISGSSDKGSVEIAAERVKMCLHNNTQNVTAIYNEAMKQLDFEIKEDATSERTKSLSKIALAASKSLDYYQLLNDRDTLKISDTCSNISAAIFILSTLTGIAGFTGRLIYKSFVPSTPLFNFPLLFTAVTISVVTLLFAGVTNDLTKSVIADADQKILLSKKSLLEALDLPLSTSKEIIPQNLRQ